MKNWISCIFLNNSYQYIYIYISYIYEIFFQFTIKIFYIYTILKKYKYHKNNKKIIKYKLIIKKKQNSE